MAEPARIPSPGPEAPLTVEPDSRDLLTIRIGGKLAPAPDVTDPETLPVPEQLQSDPVDMSPDFDAEATDVLTGNDMIADWVAARPPEGSSPETFSLIESAGYDAPKVVGDNLEIDLTPKDKPPPTTDASLVDPNDEEGRIFIEASKILRPLIDGAVWGSLYTDPDQDAAQWGLEFMGWFEWNLVSMGMSLHKIQNAPDNQKMALLYMMEFYRKKDASWDGTKRALGAVISDPSTYLGLGTLGFGAFLGASAKQATRAGVIAALRASLPAAKLGALEGAVYGGGQNLMEQGVRITAGAQEELNLGETALVAGVGAGAGFALVTTLGAGGKLAKDVAVAAAKAVKRSRPKPMGQFSTDINAPIVAETRKKAEKIQPTIEIKGSERNRLRQKWVEKLDKPAERREKIIYIVLGPPASGKTMIAKPLAKRTGSTVPDSDDAKALAPEFDNGIGSAATHDESDMIMISHLWRAMQRGDNIVLPLVGKNVEKIEKLLNSPDVNGLGGGLKAQGYEAHLVLVDLPIEEAAARSVTRLVETHADPKAVTRWVDPEYVLSIKDFPSQTYETLKGQFKSYVKYSNDVPFGTPPKIIEQSGK